MELLTLLLQQQGGSSWSGMLMIIAMVVVFYFFMIRPQTKKQKEIKKAREAMQPGDKVITAGGIFGTIRSINAEEGTLKMEIAPQCVIKVSREQVFPAAAEAQKSEKK